MPNFFSRLNYSFGNEDPDAEHLALNVQPNDRILCVTGSGDRPLHLLMKECKEVVAIDANPIQNHLLHLKMASMKHHNYDDYISFLGIQPHKERRAELKKLSKHMPEESARHWEKKKKQIHKGILFQGAMERVLKLVPLVARLCIGKKKLNKLFAFDSIKDQQHFIENHWESYSWKKLLQVVLGAKWTRSLTKDPGLYAYVDSSIKPGVHLHNRINSSLKNHLAKDNFFISLCLKGQVEKHALPPYLTFNGMENIRNSLNKIQTHTGDLIQYLENCPPNSFDAFSLSDVPSYISQETFKRLLDAVYRAARPGARFCFREFLSRYSIPQEYVGKFVRNESLEQQLDEQDRCFVYRFLVGHVQKT